MNKKYMVFLVLQIFLCQVVESSQVRSDKSTLTNIGYFLAGVAAAEGGRWVWNQGRIIIQQHQFALGVSAGAAVLGGLLYRQ